MHWRRGTSIPGQAFARRNSSTNCPISHSPRPRRLIRGAVRDGGGPVAHRRLDPAALHPDGHLDRLEVAGPYRMALVAASLTARTRSSTTSPGMAAGSSCKLVRTARAPARHGRSAMRQGDFPAIARCRRCGRHALVGGPAGPDSTAPSPDEGEGGVAPAQPLPAAKPASRSSSAASGPVPCSRYCRSPWL
jgi:hypothetical protein